MEVKTSISSSLSRLKARPKIGSIRRFGENGVLYEVIREVDDTSVMIRVLDTDEETLYPIVNVQKDPAN